MSRLGVFGSKEKLKNILRDVVINYYGVNEAFEEILSWHKTERKKWAMGLLESEKERISKWNQQYEAQRDGVKDVIFSIRKNLKEG